MPLFRSASSRSWWATVSQLKSRVSKTSASGQKRIVVPEWVLRPPVVMGATALPRLYSWWWILPPRWTVASTFSERALTTDIPTPWRPEETLYPPPPNLPPAWSTVMTTSSAGFFCLGMMSTGIPRPLSETEADRSACRFTTIRSA